MEHDPKNPDIVDLLRKLKEASGGYPQEMLALRRQGYLKQMGEVVGGAGLALGMRETLKSGKGAGSSAAAGKVVELVLVAAIVLEVGAVTYFYRDKVVDYFRSFSNEPKVEEVSNPPILSSPVPETELVPTLVETPTFTVTDTPVSTSTPTVELAAQPTEQDKQDQETGSPGGGTGGTAGSGSGGGSESVSTPDPNANNNNNGNNGNHYGQTPKPERTKEPGNENSNNNQDNKEK